MNYLCKTAAAATLGEQSGSGLGWLGADTFFLIFISSFELLIFINLMKLLYYVLTNYLCNSGSGTCTLKVLASGHGQKKHRSFLHTLFVTIKFGLKSFKHVSEQKKKTLRSVLRSISVTKKFRPGITFSIGETNPVVILIKSLKFFSMEWETGADGSQFCRSGGGLQREGSRQRSERTTKGRQRCSFRHKLRPPKP